MLSKLHDWLKNGMPRYRHWHCLRLHQRLVAQRIVQFGDLKFDIHATHEPVAQAVVAGDLEVDERRFCRQFLRPDDRVLECGGNLGFLAVTMRKELKIEQWVSMEPNPETAEIYRTNCRLNGLDPKLIEAAVTRKDGPVKLSCSPVSGEDSLLPSDEETRCLEVSGLSFPSLLKRLEWAPTAMVIDVEGGEDFLLDARLPESVRLVVIEMHPDRTGPRLVFKILGALMAQGLSVEDYRNDVYALLRGPA